MRVIAGIAKGHRLVAPPGGDVRPTSDRTKEALFSILQPVVVRASVLDLFAGAGSLGIEALSRGAARATFVDRSRRALEVVERNLQATRLEERASLVRGEAREALRGDLPGAPFDVALLDPPYRIEPGALEEVLAALVGRLAPGATISVELSTHGGAPRWPAGVLVEEPRRYGDTRLHLARRREEVDPT